MEPKVSIILATYNPRLDWFKLFLDSINNQDYPNYNVVVLDDCSTDIPIEELRAIVREHITNVPVKITRNQKNIGAIKSFEALLSLTESEYVAFADQDDIWHKDKLSKCMETLISSGKKMTYSDVCIINEDNKVESNSIIGYKKRFKFFDEDPFEHLIYKNFVIGCTVVIERKFALEAAPFTLNMYHDQYLALHASYNKELIRTKESLIDYRLHEDNQTHTLGKVTTKEDYYNENILKFYERVTFLKEKFNNKELDRAYEWSCTRIANYKKEEGARKKLKGFKDINPPTTKFELYALNRPLLFKLAVKLVKKNII